MPAAQQKMRVAEISETSRKECENKKTLEFIEQVTSNPDEVQLKVLSEILTRSAQVEYLQRHGLAGRTDRLTFKKLIPVVKYEHLQPDINRIANGDNSPILCSHPISEFLTRFVVSTKRSQYIPHKALFRSNSYVSMLFFSVVIFSNIYVSFFYCLTSV